MEKFAFSYVALFVAILIIQGVDSTIFTFKNSCRFIVWPATLTAAGRPQLSQNGFELQPNSSPVSLTAPTGWSGRFWARTQCSTDSSGKFSCLTGDCGSGQVAYNGAGGAAPTALVEFTLQGNNGNTQDFYDTSLVDGFNIPVSVVPQVGSSFGISSCPANVNSQCPHELQVYQPDGVVIACMSACLAFNTDEYCCRGAFGGPSVCKPSKYSMMFKSQCPKTYSYAFDDSTITFTCAAAPSYLITYCP